jgi:hypothetical protein
MQLQIRPSAAHRWIHCTKAPHLESRLPDTTNPYAAEGIEAHKLAAAILKNETTVINKELLKHVEMYTDYINEKKPKKLLVEHKLKMLPGISGTADCIFTKKDKVYVVDYKHGAGIEVDVTDNPQLILYAIGALDLFPESKKIVIVIVQPRNGGIKKQVYTRKEIKKFKKQFLAKIKEIHEDPKFDIGTHCKYCKAEAMCIARYNQVIDAYNDYMKTEDFLVLLNKADEFESLLGAIRGKAFELLSKGVKIPNWKLVQKRESAQWNIKDEEKLSDKLEDICEEKEIKTEDLYRLKTLTELQKILPKGSIDDLIIRKSSGVTMAKADDKRPEINSTDDFNDGVKENEKETQEK